MLYKARGHFNFHLHNSLDKFLPSFNFIELFGVYNHLVFLPLVQASALFLGGRVKSQIVNICRFVGCRVSVKTARLCRWSVETASGH